MKNLIILSMLFALVSTTLLNRAKPTIVLKRYSSSKEYDSLSFDKNVDRFILRSKIGFDTIKFDDSVSYFAGAFNETNYEKKRSIAFESVHGTAFCLKGFHYSNESDCDTAMDYWFNHFGTYGAPINPKNQTQKCPSPKLFALRTPVDVFLLFPGDSMNTKYYERIKSIFFESFYHDGKVTLVNHDGRGTLTIRTLRHPLTAAPSE